MFSDKAVFITGATGFLGRFVTERLLAAGAEVHALIRESARERRHAAIERLDTLAGEAPGSLVWVPGDLLHDPVTSADLGGFDHVFHVAALYDLGATEETLFAVNVEGTRRLLAALERASFDGIFHHISSVAVAGDWQKAFGESDFDLGQAHPHPYPRSKFEGERLVRDSTAFAWRIYRPAAVVGHSETGEVDKLDGPYFAFPLVQRLNRLIPDGFPLTGFKTRGRFNMVPVDYCADAIVHLAGAAGTDRACYHLTDPRPRPSIESFNAVLKAAGGPRFRRILPIALAGMIPGLAAAGSLGSVKMMARRVFEKEQVPVDILNAANDRVKLTCGETTAALAGSGITCPPFPSYAGVLWQYYLRQLDPYRDRDKRRRDALAGKRVLITGASSGIGREGARLAARCGAHVFVVARRAERLDSLCEEIRRDGGEATPYAVDLADHDEVQRLVAEVTEAHGGVDILVNNAARSIRRSVSESLDRPHDFERTMHLNYFSSLRLCLGFLPGMLERRSGQLVHSSTAGVWGPAARFAAYIASKAALDVFYSSVDAEYCDRGIRATSIHFPLVKTEMIAPTDDYKDMPAMSEQRAGEMLVDAMVDRPRRVMTPLARAMAMGSAAWPDLNSFFFNVLHHLWPVGPDEHPELQVDRLMLSPFLRKSPL